MIVKLVNHVASRWNPCLTRQALCAAAGVIVVALFHGGGEPAAASFIAEPWDKVAHFAVYGVITVLLWLGAGGRAPLAVVAVVIAIGALDEMHQMNVPGRTADVMDFLVDGMGAAAAGALMLQLLAYPAVRERGTDIDRPRNPAKSVTVE